jgi:DNA-binding MarR family transcriptional regulator
VLEKNIEATIIQHLLEFADQMRRGGDIVLSPADNITSQQWLILLHLSGDPNLPSYYRRRNGDPIHASELAKLINVTKANITNLLNALAEKGLILQVEDEFDRRKKCLYLSDKGKNLISKIAPRRLQANERLFAHFSEDEKRNFLDYIIRCVRLNRKLIREDKEEGVTR